MNISGRITEIREILRRQRRECLKIGLVPTMGALHEGHYSLIRRCREECDYVVVSVFVNPTQFGVGEDLGRYPRSFEDDCQGCRELGVDMVFAPTVEEMYPSESLAWVNVERLTEGLCGASRPGHFRGVCTIVAKLFNIAGPDVAYFGQKDAQQLAVIRRMVAELNFPVEIRACPIVREADGLALSSRNRYLNAEERRAARCLYRSLGRAKALFEAGQRECSVLIEAIREVVEAEASARVDYISIVDNELMCPLEVIDRCGLAALAVFIGDVRLIDNMVLDSANKNQRKNIMDPAMSNS